MHLTHYGHACVLVDTGTARLLFDPGAFSSGFESLDGLDAILVTHQHFDHVVPETLQALLRANPDAALVTDGQTAGQLDGVDARTVAPGDRLTVGGAEISVVGSGDHAVLHPDIPVIANNGYLVTADGDTLLHPGDAYVPPGIDDLQTLLLPTGAPWLKISEAVDYLRSVAPRTAVPIHEQTLANPALHHGFFENLGPEGTTLLVPDREQTVGL
ncbi:beta-lactamase [Pseudonocardia sp. EC080610-09]|uniref:MBL fold metallo-hydrolase n=1 Tax=unclassified Pseudonocardia TaxID=2619320 RepID=UPI0006CB75AC|nr:MULTISPECIES: MBL fold metallo-hydrolase [unclassified Pseudonocardia]ALE75253.1 beta-lactamase [Pseudonocardia sp. EC080625-04]ALL74617.1 beta-lactamase [Pseudonocardia sp. EC080610-09]ALL81637.1 beta-lactamase [Pseudonocardia sp. EC080619-01]